MRKLDLRKDIEMYTTFQMRFNPPFGPKSIDCVWDKRDPKISRKRAKHVTAVIVCHDESFGVYEVLKVRGFYVYTPNYAYERGCR